MGFLDFLGQNYGAFVGYVTTGVFVILISTYVVREVCYKRFGIDVCPGAAGSLSRARERRQIMMDQRAAREIQQVMEREGRTDASNRRRDERRAKYEVFLEPYTMVVRQEDFYHPSLSHPPKQQPEDIETGSIPSISSKETFSSSDSDEGEDSNSVGHHEKRDEQVLLTLPVTSADGTPRRVEASCSICLMDYEEGESVIRSTRKKCPHAFHSECILLWLSKGKKRCPCCRHFFVPGQAVDDKKFIVDNNNGSADETIQEEESDEDVNATVDEAATEAAIIEEIRNSAHHQSSPTSRVDTPRRRNSGFEEQVVPLPLEAETIVTANTT